MKLIEALKQVKEIQRKVTETTAKIAAHSADMDHETPTYPDQRAQVSAWIQSVSDLLKEILKLRIGIQKTNLATKVKIKLGDNFVEKSIAEWIHRRKDLAGIEENARKALTDRSLKESFQIDQTNGQKLTLKLRRYYDPREKDKNVELFRGEPSIIDATLETVNAVTDIVD
jgi:hypothetical protein